MLRNDCKTSQKQEFGTPELRDLVEKMQEAAHQEPDGVALAAPQNRCKQDNICNRRTCL